MIFIGIVHNKNRDMPQGINIFGAGTESENLHKIS